MGKIAEDFSIKKDCVFTDSNGNSFSYNGSADVKGIKAGDGRFYLMDLLRLSPRDTNFPDPIKHETCVIRSELIGQFIQR